MVEPSLQKGVLNSFQQMIVEFNSTRSEAVYEILVLQNHMWATIFMSLWNSISCQEIELESCLR